jgi:hypothetical protein
MGKPTARDQMPLQAQVVIEPFKKWALDFVGPYLPVASEQSVVDFLFNDIFTRFGVPQEIVTDKGN